MFVFWAIFSFAFIIFEVKDFFIVRTYHGNKINKLDREDDISHQSIKNMDGIRINVTTQKKINEINDQSNKWYYQTKIPQKGKGGEFKIFSRMN